MRLSKYLLVGLLFILVFSGISCAECSHHGVSNKVQPLGENGENPPTIEWSFASGNMTAATGMLWDGFYTGQTQLTWPYSSWINDSDDVDTVFFQYRYSNDGAWMNRTPSMAEGNVTCGRYSYTLVQTIEWDWDANRPVVEGGLYVEFRIFANDSLGNWRTTLKTFKSGNWLSIDPPPIVSNPDIFPIIVLGAISLVAVLAIVLYTRHR